MADGSERMPELDTLVRAAAEEAGRRTVAPGYDAVVRRARRRRSGRIATGAFGLVAAVVIGVVAGTGPHLDAAPDPGPPATRTADDPVLRPLRTSVPILTFTRARDTTADEDAVRTAIFSALPGDRDYTETEDLRRFFPGAPVGGPAVLFDQSATLAQLEQAAANLRKVRGIQDARVVPVPGMWFTVSASRVADEGPGNWAEQGIDVGGLPGVGGAASSGQRNDKGELVRTVRLTYTGPGVTRAEYDLIRSRVGAALGLDASQVTVTPESVAAASGSPRPKSS